MTPAGAAGTASGQYRAEPPHVEGVDGLREKIADTLGKVSGFPHPNPHLLAADALLFGPLAPLLAKLRAVEECYQDGRSQGYVLDSALRRALDAS